MPQYDSSFNSVFIKTWNTMFKEDTIDSVNELIESIIENTDFEDHSTGGHKLGGYPFFTQWDPRDEDRSKHEFLLFQLDSDFGEGMDVMWGDAGVGNFFISESDLRNLDFSDVLYNWDCY